MWIAIDPTGGILEARPKHLLKKTQFFKVWEPRVLEKYLLYGLREIPTFLKTLPKQPPVLSHLQLQNIKRRGPTCDRTSPRRRRIHLTM